MPCFFHRIKTDEKNEDLKKYKVTACEYMIYERAWEERRCNSKIVPDL
jgi:hypothetical protein